MRKRKSSILEAVHETAVDLHRAGVMGDARLREFDLLCKQPSAPKADPSPIPPDPSTLATFAQATLAGRRLLAHGPLAKAASFKAGRIHVELNNGCAFVFPAARAQELAGAKAAELRQVEIAAGGLNLHFPRLDADLYVPNLLKGVLGTKRWMSQIGAIGAHTSSAAKAQAASSNGKLGGRPKKAAAGAD